MYRGYIYSPVRLLPTTTAANNQPGSEGCFIFFAVEHSLRLPISTFTVKRILQSIFRHPVPLVVCIWILRQVSSFKVLNQYRGDIDTFAIYSSGD